jgi:hypothetical protein
MRNALGMAVVLVAALTVVASGSSATTVFSIDCDSSSQCANAFLDLDFTKELGGNVRWGNGATNGDWEYSVVDATDHPVDDVGPRQHAWASSPSTNDHTVSFDWDGLGTITLDPGLPAGASVATGFPAGPINALAIRARAGTGDVANLLSPITISFDSGGPNVVLATLTGDGDAEYVVVVDSRLSGGFEVVAHAQLGDGSGSLPQYGFKVGFFVPEPNTLLLVGLGLSLLACRRRAE